MADIPSAKEATVREYLHSLREDWEAKQIETRRVELTAELAALDETLGGDLDVIEELRVRSRRAAVLIEMNRKPTVDRGRLEDAFVEMAHAFGMREGITYAAWREMGVESAVLTRAGIKRAAVTPASAAADAKRTGRPRRAASDIDAQRHAILAELLANGEVANESGGATDILFKRLGDAIPHILMLRKRLSEMDREGLIERDLPAGTKRTYSIRISDKGRALLKREDKAHDKAHGKAAGGAAASSRSTHG